MRIGRKLPFAVTWMLMVLVALLFGTTISRADTVIECSDDEAIRLEVEAVQDPHPATLSWVSLDRASVGVGGTVTLSYGVEDADGVAWVSPSFTMGSRGYGTSTSTSASGQPAPLTISVSSDMVGRWRLSELAVGDGSGYITRFLDRAYAEETGRDATGYVLADLSAAAFEVVSTPEHTPAFADVAGVSHYDDISWLAVQGISQGWAMPDGTLQFRPYEKVARADMAAFLFRLAKCWGIVSDGWQPKASTSFKDVNSKTAHYNEILWLAENGISMGWGVSGGRREFRPYEKVARADMAAFLTRLQTLRTGNKSKGQVGAFSDVTDTTAHFEEISWLARSGVSKGWQMIDGTFQFRPYEKVARADMAAFLHRMDDLE